MVRPLKVRVSHIFDFDRAQIPIVFNVVAIAAGVRVLTCIFRWPLVSLLTVFIEPLLEIATAIFFAVALIWACVHAIRRRPERSANRYSPLLLALTALAVFIFVPFTEIYLKANFVLLLNRRTAAAVHVLQTRPVQSATNADEGDLVGLPGLSDDGEGMYLHTAGKQMVFFFTFRGIVDHFSGFVYSANDAPPQKDDFGGDFVEVRHLRKNWYWAASI